MTKRSVFSAFRQLVLLSLLAALGFEQFSERDAVKQIAAVDGVDNGKHDPINGDPNFIAQFEMVVTLLHNNSQNWKRGRSDDGRFLLSPEVQDIPVTVCSPDELVSETVYQNGLETKHFRPEEEGVYDHLVSSNRSGSLRFLPIVNGKRGQEVPGYLNYILHNYDVLPDVVIFLHSNPFAHGKNILNNIRYVVDHWTPQQIGFLHLNENVMCRSSGGGGAWGRFWELLGFNLSHVPTYIKQPCCAQFMVTRDRIHLRPKWFYQQLLKLTYTRSESAFQEHYWHIFFGESAILADDREIQHYFHSNWTRPVRDAVLHNPYPSLPCSKSMRPWLEKSIADPAAYFPNMSTSREEVCPPGAMHL